MLCPRCHQAAVDQDLICPRCGAGPPPGRRVPLTKTQRLLLILEQASMAICFLVLGGLLLAGALRQLSPAAGAALGTLFAAATISLVAWALRRELPGALQGWALELDDTLIEVEERGRVVSMVFAQAGKLNLPQNLGLRPGELIRGCRYRLLYSPLRRRLWRMELIERPGRWADEPIERPDWL